MDFDEAHKANMQAGFPSKLTDYTASGLPLLICGPSYCSAVLWALDNPGVAEVVTDASQNSLTRAVEQLVNNPNHRFQIATEALKKGRKYFSHPVIIEQFYRSIRMTF
jgi:glycosyltransferase involved in cell wall biosynthesis